MESIFLQLTSLLVVAVGIAFATKLLRQPLIVAYIIAGVVCGPLILNLLGGKQEPYETFAQFGVVLLLFIIGLNLDFKHLRAIGRVSVYTGLGQVLFTAGIGTILLMAINFQMKTAIFLAMAMTFSSTIMIMKLLSDKKDSEKIYGRYTIGLMLVQDIIAVILIIVLGFMRGEHGSALQSFALPIMKLIAAAAILFVVSKYALPFILEKIADTGELLFLFTLGWCLGVTSILYLLGFSLEIGAILSGIALSSSPYRLEIGGRMKPLRDFFLILFFIVLGSEMGLHAIGEVLGPALALSLFILIGNPLILYVIFRALKFTRRNSVLAGLTAAQVSEFGFVLIFAGVQAGHIHGRELALFTAVAIITIFTSSYLITYNEHIYRLLAPLLEKFGPEKIRQHERRAGKVHVWLIGYHRIGTEVAKALRDLHAKFAVIDYDPAIVSTLRKARIPFRFGDVSDTEFLEDVSLASGSMIIMTIPSANDQIHVMEYVRKRNKRILIIANADQQQDARELYEHGANFVMMPHMIGGQWIAKLLRERKWNKGALDRLKQTQEEALNA